MDKQFKNKAVAGITWLVGLYLSLVVTTNLAQIFQDWQQSFSGSSDFYPLAITTLIVLSPVSLGVIGYFVISNVRSVILPPLIIHVLIAAASPIILALTVLLIYWWVSYESGPGSPD